MHHVCTLTHIDECSCGAEELAHQHEIGGVIVYELLDQPHLYPSSEALYGLVRVVKDAAGVLTVGKAKPSFYEVERFNTL